MKMKMKKVNNIKIDDYEGSIYGACKHFNVPINVFCGRFYRLKWGLEKSLKTPYVKKEKRTIEEKNNIIEIIIKIIQN